MRRFAFLLILLALAVAAGALRASAQTFNSPSCVQNGGYPFQQGGCLNAQDLNKAIEGSPSPYPPQNQTGTGAGLGKYWLDSSTGPTTPTLRQCVNPSGCSRNYTPSDWLNWGVYNVNTQTFAFSAAVGGLTPITITAAAPLYFSGPSSNILNLSLSSDFTVNGSNQLALSANVLRASNNLSDVASKYTAANNIGTTTTITTSGTFLIGATTTLWGPISCGDGTLNLPASPADNEPHTIVNLGLCPSNSMTVSGNGKNIGLGSAVVSTGPGVINVRYSAAAGFWGPGDVSSVAGALTYTAVNVANNGSDFSNPAAVPANIGALPHVATLAALQAASIATYGGAGAQLVRDDYIAGLGSPKITYTAETGNCAANSRVNDGGSCANTTSGGNSWYATFTGTADVRIWGAPVTGNAPSVGSDAEPAIAACLAALGPKGVCQLNKRHTILTNLVLPTATSIKCPETPVSGLFSGSFTYLNDDPAILLASGITITAGGAGAGVYNCNVVPSGLTIPISSGSAFYPQTAISDAGNFDFSVKDSTIGGFNSAIQVSGPRPNLDHDYLDGAGNTVAVLQWDVGNTDSGFINDVKIQQIVTSGTASSCSVLLKPGVGLRIGVASGVGAASVFMDNVVVQGFLTKNYDFENSAIIGNIWSDGASNTGCASSYPNTQVGVYIAPNVTVYGGSINENQNYTGLVDNSSSVFNTIGAVSIGQSLGDCLQLGTSGTAGVAHFRDLFASACGISGTGHAIDFKNAGSKLISDIWTLALGNTESAAAPYIVGTGSIPIGQEMRGNAFAANIDTDLPTSGINGTSLFDGSFYLSGGADIVIGAMSAPLGPVSAVSGGSGSTASVVGTEAKGTITFTAGSGTFSTATVTVSPLTIPLGSAGSGLCTGAPTNNGVSPWTGPATIIGSILSDTSIEFYLTNGANFVPTDSYTFGYRCEFF
jgi:hypothetical protein